MSRLANGVVGGVAAGLGSNGTAIVGLAAAAIKNPNAVLNTVEQMATNYAVGMVTNFVNKEVGLATNYIAGQVQSGVSYVAGQLNSGLSFAGASTFTGGLQNTVNDVSYSLGLGSGSGVQNIGGVDIPFSALND